MRYIIANIIAIIHITVRSVVSIILTNWFNNKILSNPYATTLVAVLHTEDIHVLCVFRAHDTLRRFLFDSALSVAI